MTENIMEQPISEPLKWRKKGFPPQGKKIYISAILTKGKKEKIEQQMIFKIEIHK